MRNKNKEPNYFAAYFISIILVLIIHYFILASLPVHTTIHVFLAFAIFTVTMGIIVTKIEKK